MQLPGSYGARCGGKDGGMGGWGTRLRLAGVGNVGRLRQVGRLGQVRRSGQVGGYPQEPKARLAGRTKYERERTNVLKADTTSMANTK